MARSLADALPGTEVQAGSSWWRGAVLYQVYLRSFQDHDGDGLGDLRGLLKRLPYIADLSVDGLWITPFFPSPMRDMGYDVRDHRSVDPRFGTLHDFDEVVACAHRLRLKVIIDQVWSHTAAEHAWFEESRASRDNPKADWYVWADAREDGSPPNNWLSWMGGSAWRWEPRRRQYHLHHFLPQMPDLNFHCPAVQDAVLDIARFWLERGVDGFRLDTANLYAHDPQLRDNPPAPEGQQGDSPVMMQSHTRTMDQPESLAFLQRLRRLMNDYPGRMTVGEIGGARALDTMQAYTSGDHALHTAYSFAFLGARPDAKAVAVQLAPWAASSGWPSWAFSNHDVPRVATRWSAQAAHPGRQKGFQLGGTSTEASASLEGALLASRSDVAGAQVADALTWMALLMALRGTVFVFQGEELGLPNSEVPFECMQDPYGLANWPLIPGRDGCRTPFPWSHEQVNAGFSEGGPWLPSDAAHRALAVDQQQADPDSPLNHTKALIRLRQREPALRSGACKVLWTHGDVLLLRRGEGERTVMALFNLGDAPAPAPWSVPDPVLNGASCLWCRPLQTAAQSRLVGRMLQPGFAAFYRADL